MSDENETTRDGFEPQFWTDPRKEEGGVAFEDPVYGYKFTLRHRKCQKAEEYFRRRAAPYAAMIAGNRQAAAKLSDKIEEEVIARVLIVSWEAFDGPDGPIECPSDKEKRKEVALEFVRDKRMRRLVSYLTGCANDDEAFAYEAPRDKTGEADLVAG